MNLSARLKSVQREHARRCVNCGGPIVPAQTLTTWKAIMDAFGNLPEGEKVAFYAHSGRMDLLPPALQEKAYRLYCQQQGLPDDGRSSPYSSPNPPPAPHFPEHGPIPKLPPRWG